MKALILAAGLGSRLAPITDTVPKSLVPVNGMPILHKQIDNLHENGITDITIISGYKGEILSDYVKSRWPEINIINSPDYATTNNMYSAYLGRDAVKGSPFLMMNADVFYDSSVVKALLSFDAPNAIVTEIGRYIEESMKVIKKDGRLYEISKKVTPEEAFGTTIDVYKFSNMAGAAFFEKCREYIEDKKELKMWSEVALNDVLKEVVFEACELQGRWLEIDNHDDLKAACELFRD
ncbi:MAG: phosphocholine cytidylyltransferase family protein [Clostridia bacterium]|nr:phosphocholine cytidylyltransferase family protein [Clostridia bacterium]